MNGIFIGILVISGFFLSLYGWYVEKKIQKNDSYKPFCDISDKLSCVKATKSPHSHLLFVSNSLVGMIFYGVMVCFFILGASSLIQLFSTAAFLVSIFMVYILFFKIKTACPVCITIYLINTLLCFFSYTL